MGATIAFVTPEEHAALQRQVEALTQLVTRLIVIEDVRVDTAEALRLTGIKSANTLRSECDRGALTGRKKTGRSVSFSRNACLLYAHTKRGMVLPAGIASALALRPAA